MGFGVGVVVAVGVGEVGAESGFIRSLGGVWEGLSIGREGIGARKRRLATVNLDVTGMTKRERRRW